MALLTWILNLSTPAAAPPTLTGTIPTLGATVNVAIPTFDTGSYFSGATSYTLTGTLPTGLSFNTGNGQITGTPTVTGLTAGYVVTATNADGSTPSNSFSVLVSAAYTGGGIATIGKSKFFRFIKGLR